jgi:hypothetical protein
VPSHVLSPFSIPHFFFFRLVCRFKQIISLKSLYYHSAFVTSCESFAAVHNNDRGSTTSNEAVFHFQSKCPPLPRFQHREFLPTEVHPRIVILNHDLAVSF